MNKQQTTFKTQFVKQILIFVPLLLALFFFNSCSSNDTLAGSDVTDDSYDTYYSDETNNSDDSYDSDEVEISLYVSDQIASYSNYDLIVSVEKVVIDDNTFYPRSSPYSFTIDKDDNINAVIHYSEYDNDIEYESSDTHQTTLYQSLGTTILAQGASLQRFDSRSEMNDILANGGFDTFGESSSNSSNDNNSDNSSNNEGTGRSTFNANAYDDHFVLNKYAILSQWGWDGFDALARGENLDDYYDGDEWEEIKLMCAYAMVYYDGYVNALNQGYSQSEASGTYEAHVGSAQTAIAYYEYSLEN